MKKKSRSRGVPPSKFPSGKSLWELFIHVPGGTPTLKLIASWVRKPTDEQVGARATHFVESTRLSGRHYVCKLRYEGRVEHTYDVFMEMEYSRSDKVR